MPQISAFFGIIIRMHFRDHPPPHFHAEHRGEHATFDFNGARRDFVAHGSTANCSVGAATSSRADGKLEQH
jgi:hypothetical protein